MLLTERLFGNNEMQVSKQKFVIWQVYMQVHNRGKSSFVRLLCGLLLRGHGAAPPLISKLPPALPQMTEWGNSLAPLCGLYADLSFNEVQRNSQDAGFLHFITTTGRQLPILARKNAIRR
jgi:hypothetical protein